MSCFVGLDVSQKTTIICGVNASGARVWRGQCATVPDEIARTLRRQLGEDIRIGIETGAMTPWLVHEPRGRGPDIVCLDARHARTALRMQIDKTDRNDAEGLALLVA